MADAATPSIGRSKRMNPGPRIVPSPARLKQAEKWAKKIADNVLSHYTPEELEEMRIRNEPVQE